MANGTILSETTCGDLKERLAESRTSAVPSSQSAGAQDFFTVGAITGATAVDVRNGADVSAYLGVTFGRSESGNYGVTETSAGFSVTSEFGDFQRPGGSSNSPIRGIEFDIEPYPIPW